VKRGNEMGPKKDGSPGKDDAIHTAKKKEKLQAELSEEFPGRLGRRLSAETKEHQEKKEQGKTCHWGSSPLGKKRKLHPSLAQTRPS